MWAECSDDEKAYMKRDNPKAFADIVVDGMKPFDEQVDAIRFGVR